MGAGCKERRTTTSKTVETKTLTAFKASIDRGNFSHDFLVTNDRGVDLYDVKLTFMFHREDGESPEFKRFWAEWKQGEEKKINVPATAYAKIVMNGSALLKPMLATMSQIDQALVVMENTVLIKDFWNFSPDQ